MVFDERSLLHPACVASPSPVSHFSFVLSLFAPFRRVSLPLAANAAAAAAAVCKSLSVSFIMCREKIYLPRNVFAMRWQSFGAPMRWATSTMCCVVCIFFLVARAERGDEIADRELKHEKKWNEINETNPDWILLLFFGICFYGFSLVLWHRWLLHAIRRAWHISKCIRNRRDSYCSRRLRHSRQLATEETDTVKTRSSHIFTIAHKEIVIFTWNHFVVSENGTE